MLRWSIHASLILAAISVWRLRVNEKFVLNPSTAAISDRTRKDPLGPSTNDRVGLFPRVWTTEVSSLTSYSPRSLPLTTNDVFINKDAAEAEHGSNKRAAQKRDDCEPFSDWYDNNNPTCNTLHEADFRSGLIGMNAYSKGWGTKLLGLGGTSAAWTVSDHACTIEDRLVVLRTLRLGKIKDITSKILADQRIDAIVTERLTSSPNVIDIYGYCGASAINELADGGDLETFLSAANYSLPSAQILSLATDAMLGMADIHSTDRDGLTTLLQKDVKCKNMAVSNGTLKYLDFNTARFLYWNSDTNKTCGFSHSFRCDGRWNRAPEDCRFNEKTAPIDFPREKKDLYYAGALLFLVLTGKHPYHFEKQNNISLPETPDRLKQWVLEGRVPSFPGTVTQSIDPSTIAVAKAVRLAMTPDINQRPSARDVADELVKALKSIKANY